MILAGSTMKISQRPFTLHEPISSALSVIWRGDYRALFFDDRILNRPDFGKTHRNAFSYLVHRFYSSNRLNGVHTNREGKESSIMKLLHAACKGVGFGHGLSTIYNNL